MAKSLLLDTHVLLWWISGSKALSPKAAQAMKEAESVLVSPISFWEVAMLREKGRIALDRSTVAWANDVLARQAIDEAPLTVSTAVAAGELPKFHGDPADRLLVATAQALRVPLLTKDHKIRAWADDYQMITCVW